MKLTFLGANRTTTGSQHLLEVNGARVLLECGMYQGRRAESIARNRHLPFDPTSVDAVVLSHAHIDHSGNLPTLCRDGFRGRIICTHATRDLCDIMLADSAHIQESDAQFVTKINARKNLPPAEPLYTSEDAAQALEQFASAHYHNAIRVADGVTVTFRDAGHILGSTTVTVDLEERGRKVRLLFSGDLGRGHNDILRDPEVTDGVDYLLCESTYGNRAHPEMKNVEDAVCKIIHYAHEQGGKIIIPAFAVGRTQQLVYTLNRLGESGRLPRLPIFVDSPMSVKVTEVFRRHPECFNDSIVKYMRDDPNPFGMENLTYTRDVEESKRLNDLKGPAIIIASSGMAEAGRIRHHLKNNIGDPRNTILMVGFCAEHTLGARIIARDPAVNIFGESYPLKARVEVIEAFSGHADKNELDAWIGGLRGEMRGIFLVHGEEDQSLAFAERLRQKYPKTTVTVPNFKDSAEL